MADINVYFELAKDILKDVKDKSAKDYIRWGGEGIGNKDRHAAWVFVDNVARKAFFLASQHDGVDCTFCMHAKKGSCELDFDQFETAFCIRIVFTTIHEMLHAFGCDEDQATEGMNLFTLLLRDEFDFFEGNFGCPLFSSILEPEATERYNRMMEKASRLLSEAKNKTAIAEFVNTMGFPRSKQPSLEEADRDG